MWGATGAAASLNVPFVADAIPGNSTKTVVVHLLSSLLSQGKNIPLNMLPLVVELELTTWNGHSPARTTTMSLRDPA